MNNLFVMRKRDIAIFGTVGFWFCIFQITGKTLADNGNILWTGEYIIKLILFSFIGAIVIGLACAFLMAKAGVNSPAKMDSVCNCHKWNSISKYKFGMLCFGLFLLCWMPCYLAYYPGICAYDVTVQTGQIESGEYNDHHPIAHTLLIKAGMVLGNMMFGSPNTGIGILVLVQMICLAGAFAFAMTLLRERGVGRIPLICLLLLGMFYPFNMYMSVSVIKDVFFSVFFLIQILSLCEIVRVKKIGFGLFDWMFGISAVGMQLFRNNGRYAMFVLQIILVITFLFAKGTRRFWGNLALNCMICLIIGSLILSGLFRVTGAEQGDRREMLSMPIQQLARCMLYHGGVGELDEDDHTMDEHAKSLINDFLLDESYREYRAEIADPVKKHTNTYVARYRAEEFIETYLELLCQYPGDFINAALAVNSGYLYVGDETHAWVNENGTDKGLGYVQTRWVEGELNPRGLYKASKWTGLYNLMEKWADKNAYLQIPIIKYLFVPGVFLWGYLFFAAYLIARRRYDRCVPLVLIMGYYITLFLGPVVQLRYIYPLMIAMPFIVFHLTRDCSADNT